MSRIASINELAELELEEAATYYEAQSPGLAGDFVAVLKREVDFLLEFPESAPIVQADVRARPLPRFPYTPRNRAASPFAASLDDHDDRRLAARSRRARLHPVFSRDGPAGADHLVRAAGFR